MDIKILEHNDRYAKFLLTGTSAAFMNAIRRIAISEVPNIAVDDVFFYENSSVLSDEMISQRLGLIPLKTDLDAYVLPEKCKCKSDMGCPECRAVGSLDVTSEDSTRTVYSGDLKFENPDVAPFSDKIPIVKLGPNQKLKVEVYARLGKGQQHAKWQPVSTCVYKNMPVITISEKLCDACKRCVTACPKQVLSIEKNRVAVIDPEKCVFCDECTKSCPNPGAINVDKKENVFIFFIESTGSLPVKRIISESAGILKIKADELAKEIKDLM